MHSIPDDVTRKTVLISLFFAGFLAGLLWLLQNVATWVFAVLKANR